MMRPRGRRPASSEEQQLQQAQDQPPPPPLQRRTSCDAAVLWGALLLIILQVSWFVYYFQFLKLPAPLSAVDAGKRGFSEERAYRHVKFLTDLGPHPVGSQALEQAVEYILSRVEEVQAEAPLDVDVEVDFFHARPGVTSLYGGLFRGRSLVYANLKHVVVRIKPASVRNAEDNAVLVSSHIDTVITSPGAGDCNSNMGVMLELLRAVSYWAHGFKHSVIFLFNTGEEEGLDGAHSFITQHPWRSSIRTAIDLEAIGVGGKSILFQGGPDKSMVELYAKAAKHPSAQIIAQDVFLSGFVKSATDFQVYREVGNLSGLDFAFMHNAAVYHTKNDKIQLLTPGSLQHLGDNILALLREAAVSDKLQSASSSPRASSKMESVYFDILGKYLVTYSQQFAKQLYGSVIAQGLLLLLMSICQGGWTSAKAFLLSLLCLLFTWGFSMSISCLVAFGLSFVGHVATPFIAHPWLAVLLFGAPALFGALVGHTLGYNALKTYLFKVRQLRSGTLQHSFKKTDIRLEDLQQSSKEVDLRLATWDAERWLFKAGSVQWLGVLAAGTWFEAGSSYIAMLWVIFPALAYGLIDATFSPQRAPCELRTMTLMAAVVVPLVCSAGSIVNFFIFMVTSLVRFDRNPGMNPDWLGNTSVAILAAVIVCLFLVYLLAYAHRAGGLKWILCGLMLVSAMALSIVSFELFPPFTEHFGRAVNVVHVVELGTSDGAESLTSSYISLSSVTPGKLTRELSFIKDEGFVCEAGDVVDMVTHTIKYGCTSRIEQEEGELDLTELPSLKIQKEVVVEGKRMVSVVLNTKAARRWVMAINATDLGEFRLEAVTEATGERSILNDVRNPISVEGWHYIQFVTNQAGPSYFELSLKWSNPTSRPSESNTGVRREKGTLLKLRTDVNRTSPKLKRTLEKLPSWVAVFGKSTSPYSLSYLVNLPTM